MRSRVLVTGATGCIGRHVVPVLLAEGWDVHAVSSQESRPRIEGVTWHRADILVAEELRAVVRRTRATHLLHLAWYVAPGKWATAPENFAWVQASLELLRSFQEHGGVRVVTAGSCLEYDWDYGYCAETRTPCSPHTYYGVCKHALQTLTSAFAANRNMTSAWGRIFFLYGPYEHPTRLVASVIRSLLADAAAHCSPGDQIRDYLFVRDVADALVALLTADVCGPVNIASGQPVAIRDIVRRIGDLTGRADLIRLGSISAAPTDVPLVVADVTHARKVLAWRPKYDLDEGLKETIEWWRQRGNVHATGSADVSTCHSRSS